MKKTLVIGGFVGVLLLVAVATNVSAQVADPFAQIWQAIKALQVKVASIRLIPGPQGPAGPAGPQGPRGISGAGNIAFIDSISNNVLRTDGTAWNSNSNGWIQALNHGVPIPTSDIVQWYWNFFLDKDGNFWSYEGGTYVNHGHP